MILLSKEAALRFKEEIGFFKDELCNQLSYYCYDIYRYQNRIDFDELISKLVVPIPPLAEQNRIVAKINEIFAML